MKIRVKKMQTHTFHMIKCATSPTDAHTTTTTKPNNASHHE